MLLMLQTLLLLVIMVAGCYLAVVPVNGWSLLLLFLFLGFGVVAMVVKHPSFLQAQAAACGQLALQMPQSVRRWGCCGANHQIPFWQLIGIHGDHRDPQSCSWS